jgi:S1-C subfamily serine protease
LISNYHVVKDATKIRLVTSAGLIDAKVVSVDAANDLALLKAEGRFAPLPIAASRTVNLGGTVATVGFSDIGLQGFAPKLAKGEIASLSGLRHDVVSLILFEFHTSPVQSVFIAKSNALATQAGRGG